MRFAFRFVCLIAVSAALVGCDSEGNPNASSSTPDPAAANAALGKMPPAPGKGGKTAPAK